MGRQLVDRMAVEVDGEGEALVMLHGLGGSSNTWTPLMPVLSHHRVVRPDLPGSGRSPRAHALEAGSLSLDRLVDSVLRVCGALGVERAWFAGHSLGTIVCTHLAARAPGLVRGLFLLGPLLAPPDPARGAIRQRAERARAEGMNGIADTIVQSTLSSDSRRAAPVVVAAVRESLLAQDPEGYARTCEALAACEPADPALIEAPVLLVTGDEDPVAPAQSVRALGARLPRARVEILGRCGHWPSFERAAECQSLLRDFLARRH